MALSNVENGEQFLSKKGDHTLTLLESREICNSNHFTAILSQIVSSSSCKQILENTE